MDNLLLKKDLTADQMVLVTSEFEKEKVKRDCLLNMVFPRWTWWASLLRT